MDYQALADELTTDPLTRGYSTMSDQQAADDLNTEYRTCTRDFVYGYEIFNVTDDTEYGALTDAQRNEWLDLCGISEIDITSGVAKEIEARLFGAGTTTRSNLSDLRSPACSRATELDLPFIRESDVAHARSL